ncbi:alkaline phosphatase family protein [Halalkalibacter kiskunsagensis]|uniref:Alkaline phosphatase family protein n=1 Tax=Halalkalibacter kiskunsagensis TaxID=1548599 RepID=A0ABV6KJA4_9BACI
MIRTYLFFMLICFLLVGCEENQPEGAMLPQSAETGAVGDHKDVIVVLIDSMTELVIKDGLKRSSLPAISYLIENGFVHHDLIAPFPSMSVAIESTLITGTSPKEHKVPGLVWYDPNDDVIVDYGSTLSKYWKLGVNDTLVNTLVHLNTNHLSPNVETVYEALHDKGYSTGSINFLVYRGHKSHDLTVPTYVKTLFRLPEKLQTKGPDLLAFGQATKPKVSQNQKVDDALYQRFGLNDSYSAQVTAKLIKENQQPDLTMIFFPNYDKDAHKHGPVSPEHFARADGYLQDILNAYESWDKALEENVFIIMGDHGQDQLKDKKEEVAIELEPLLDPYTVAPLLDEPSSGDVVISNNHRMAYLYPTSNISYFDLASKLHQDYRIDHLSWLEGEELVIYQSGKEGVLRIKEGGDWQDQYGQTWTINGNKSIVDIHLNQSEMKLEYGNYPDVFHQLYGALLSHSETMIVTAKPGYTLKSEGAPVHNKGGEHGGLHKNDTRTSIVIAGTDKELHDRRMESLKEYFLSLFDDES